MHIAFIASECAPYAKSGGLADVVSALPRELVRQGHEVSVYLPLYRSVATYMTEQKLPRKVLIPSLTVPFRTYNRFVTVVDGGKPDGVQMYFLDCPELFDRDGIYGNDRGDYPDNAERFGLLSRATIEASKRLGVPNVFSVHDWEAGVVPVMLRTLYYFDPLLRKVPVVLTIHNAGYQGTFPPATTELLLLPWDVFTMDRVEQNDAFNFLKGGIVYSDAITAVSPRYAQEIQTPEFGNGLDPTLRRRASDLIGIINGVDYTEWDPATDTHIAAHYTPKDLAGKVECRRDLLHAFSLDEIAPETPVLGIVSRFATQKGLDILGAAMEQIAAEEIAFVALGSGERFYEEMFQALQTRFPGKIAVRIGYDNALAHKIEAGADMFLMPSRYEPCGLNQIYSLKYGTVPIVRATGGLDDTIQEWDSATGLGTGFKFSGYDPVDFYAAIERALAVFPDKKAWTKLMRNGMAQNFSWEGSAKQYITVFEEVVKRRS
jgi:starch synthase